VTVPPGSGTLKFVAQGPNGVTSTVTVTLTVQGPATFYGLHGITVTDGSTIFGGALYAGAGGQVSIGNDATVGSIFSLSPVLLHDRTTVSVIDTNAGLTQGSTDHIGSILTTRPTFPAFPSPSAQFTGTKTETFGPDGSFTLAPGQYGPLTVYSRAKLTLSAGNYEFTSFDLEPQAVLVVPSAGSEAVHVFVKNSVIYRGSTTIAGGTLAPLYLAYFGSAAVTIESVFLGTVVAPNASLNLQSLNGAGSYQGEFFAAQVTTLAPHSNVIPDAFTCK